MTLYVDGVEYTNNSMKATPPVEPAQRSALWQWLKAEKRHIVLEKRRKRQEGVNPHILMLRRQGHPEAPQYNNRASKRANQRAARLAIKRMARQAQNEAA